MRVYTLPAGMEWNPLLKFPRNLPCPCMSGKKWKQCHLKKITAVIPIDLARQYVVAMQNPETLRFVQPKGTK